MAQSTIPLPSHSEFPQAQSRVSRFQQLLNERDAMAYQVVGAAQSLVSKRTRCDAEDFVDTLKSVLRRYDAADVAINQFYQSSREESNVR